jgi:rod shape-determining protein MreD
MSLRDSFVGFFFMLLIAMILQLVQLPDLIAPARPLWVPMLLAFWTYMAPARVSLLLAWIAGLALDVLFNTGLGQHALGLVVTVYAVARMRKLLIVLPFWQTTLALIPVWVLYALLMFWIDGTRAQAADLWIRWLPVVSTTLLWPLFFPLLNRLGKPSRE